MPLSSASVYSIPTFRSFTFFRLGAIALGQQDINAGLDMIMVPDAYKTFISTLDTEIKAGNIPMSRIDDAVTRILTVKFALGLFTQPYTNRSYTLWDRRRIAR